MEQNKIDPDLRSLEEWYAEYMTQDNPVENSIYPESLNVDVIEARILDCMKHIEVTDGFCSICQAMLNNWPDTAAKEREIEIAKVAGNTGLITISHSLFTDLRPGLWIEHDGRASYVLPCQGQTVRLESSLRQGCRNCGLILQTLKDENWLPTYRKIEERLNILGKPSNISLLTYKDEYATSGYLVLGFPGRIFDAFETFKPLTLRIFPYQGIFYGLFQPFSSSPWQVLASQSSPMRLARRWTTRCLDSHRRCDLERQPFYPTRLLSIAADTIQLVITEGWPDRPLYATLSHCWGKIEFDTLKSNNIEDLKHGIKNRYLSKTFADAIKIARFVGLNYLWIDSLCIIQDNIKDWDIEAGRMASVYGGSSLNIAASSAKNGTEGCFLKPQYHGGGFRARVCISGRTEIHEFTSGNEYKRSVTQSHLATRAWTVQEKILAPRTLHCGDQGFFWECRSHMASEYFPDGFCKDGGFPRLAHASVLPDDWNPRSAWRAIKNWYSGCDLTQSGDKLIALSGVVRSFQDKTRGRYFAGLWRHSMEEELCWRPLDPRQRPAYRAPSWSWAAVDGPVSTKLVGSKYDDIVYANVHSVSVMNAGGNTLGAVIHGTLSLHCKLIVPGIIAADAAARAMRKSRQILHGLNPDEERAIRFSNLGGEGYVFPFLLDCAEEKDLRLGQSIYYLPLRAIGRGQVYHPIQGFDTSQRGVFGIVLEAVHASLNRYRRIGSFEYSSQGWFVNGDDSVVSLFEDYANFMGVSRGILSASDGEITVNIV